MNGIALKPCRLLFPPGGQRPNPGVQVVGDPTRDVVDDHKTPSEMRAVVVALAHPVAVMGVAADDVGVANAGAFLVVD